MLIICEDCAKRYNIDESRIRGNRARFSCKECGHIIIVEKSDITRRLISSSPALSTGKSRTGADLFREADEHVGASFSDESASEGTEDLLREGVQGAKKSVPILGYFLLAFLAVFLLISGVLAYLYIEHVDGLLLKEGAQAEFLGSSFLLLGVAWVFVLGIFYFLGRSLARPIAGLKEDIVKFGRGEQEGPISLAGPKEVQELAEALSRITRPRR